MSFRIPEEKIREIRERADILQVVGDRVALKKAGVRFVGLCPFHQEKTPSFSVHPGMGIFHANAPGHATACASLDRKRRCTQVEVMP